MASQVNENGPIIAAKQRGPGPAKYGLPATVGYRDHDPRKLRHPAYSFGARTVIKENDRSPGPVYYPSKYITSRGRIGTPSYSLVGKPKDMAAFMSPAPGSYKPEKCPIPNNTKAPSFSFGIRTTPWKEDSSPAPNAYMLPNLTGSKCAVKASGAAYSMKSRQAVGAYYEDLQKTPGPGTYNACNMNSVTKKYPVYTLQGKNYGGKEANRNPGPGTYELDSSRKKSGPAFSFGVRHTDYKTMLMDD